MFCIMNNSLRAWSAVKGIIMSQVPSVYTVGSTCMYTTELVQGEYKKLCRR